MHEHVRYDAAMEAARRIGELATSGGPLTPERLSKIVYTVLEAMYRAEAVLAEYACRFACPHCFREYRINESLRGRLVTCRRCGHRWRSPETFGRN